MVTSLLKMCTLGKQNILYIGDHDHVSKKWMSLFVCNIILSPGVFRSSLFQTFGQAEGE